MADDIPEKPKRGGYKNPPQDKRYPKGTSGNPGGRPKAQPPELDRDIIATFETKLQNSKQTVIQALLMKTTRLAVGGDMKAMQMSFAMYGSAKSRQKKTSTDDAADKAFFEEVLRSHSELLTDLQEEPPTSGSAEGGGSDDDD